MNKKEFMEAWKLTEEEYKEIKLMSNFSMSVYKLLERGYTEQEIKTELEEVFKRYKAIVGKLK